MTQSESTYTAFLQHLKRYERYEPAPRSRGPEKLEAVRRLMTRLNHPERTFRVIHVAGTNGKGLTAAMIARLLLQQGHRCGLYTSPHVRELRERIVIDGAPVGEAACARAGHAVLDQVGDLERTLYVSYFDVLTAVGLQAFREAGVTWAVLEAGMGGRSDATNITDKALAVLTRIGWDHVGILGDTLPQIAAQKVGIVRAGVPTVVGAQPGELAEWLPAQVQQAGSVPVDARAYRVESEAEEPGWLRAHWPGAAPLLLVAPHEPTVPHLQCAANALAAADTLFGPADEPTRRAWALVALQTQLPGRLERHHDVPVRDHGGPPLGTVVLDGGHNPEALQALTAQLAVWDVSDYALIFAMQADKFIPQAQEPLQALFAGAHHVHTVSLHTPRSPAATEIAARIASVVAGTGRAVPVTPHDDARQAVLAAAAEPDRPLVVCGSFWLLGAVLAHLDVEPEGAFTGEQSAS